jgi:hypothetical protein
MTSDRLTPKQSFESFGGLDGWGFGVAVGLRGDDLWRTPGRYGWDGGLCTSWLQRPGRGPGGDPADPAPGVPDREPVWLDFWTSVYTALEG